MVRAALLVYAPTGLLAIAWIAWRHGAEEALARIVGAHPLRDVVLGLGVGLMIVGLTRGLSAAFALARRAEAALADAIGPLTTAQCVALALASGIAEELVFRGLVQPAIGLVLASLLFGAVHVPMRRELLAWPFFAAAIGALLGVMAIRTDALAAPILAHVTVNAVNLRFITPAPTSS